MHYFMHIHVHIIYIECAPASPAMACFHSGTDLVFSPRLCQSLPAATISGKPWCCARLKGHSTYQETDCIYIYSFMSMDVSLRSPCLLSAKSSKRRTLTASRCLFLAVVLYFQSHFWTTI